MPLKYKELIFYFFLGNISAEINIEQKLRLSFPAFQDWIVSRFQAGIVKMWYSQNRIPTKTPFKEYKELLKDRQHYCSEFIEILLKLDCESLYEMFSKFSEEDFKDSKRFEIVREFMVVCEKEQSQFLVPNKFLNDAFGKNTSLN